MCDMPNKFLIGGNIFIDYGLKSLICLWKKMVKIYQKQRIVSSLGTSQEQYSGNN